MSSNSPPEGLRRRAALQRYAILDTAPEPAFTQIAQTAASLFEAPMALVGFIDDDRQWHKAMVGFDRREMPIRHALCADVLEAEGGLLVEDAAQDERFAAHPMVTAEPHIRFVAGVPLTTPTGTRIGTLCVMDPEPQSPANARLNQLALLADVVVMELELRAQRHAEEESAAGETEGEAAAPSPFVRRLGFALSASDHQVLVLNADTLEIVDASRGAWRDLGQRGEALVGRTLMKVTGAEKEVLDRQLEPVRDRTATQGLLKISVPSQAVTPDAPAASMHFLVLSASQASPPVLVAIALTFSERLHLEAQLRQRQNIETVRELVGGIAHNFNNILHSAIAYLQMARQELGDVGTPGEFLAETEDDLHEAADLVSKLQSFSEREGKAIDLSVDLSTITKEAIDLVEPSVPTEVDVDVDLASDAVVAGDPAPLREMVVNLLTNAVEALPGEGTIAVEVQTVEVDPNLARQHFNLTPGPHVCLAIRDTGRGMDPAMVERVFEPFYTTKEAPRVVGLGLSVAHGVVEAHNGEIDIDTEPGKGTTVRVYLPKAQD